MSYISELVRSSWIHVSEDLRAMQLRGKRSRNKASVGEPADGSFVIDVK